MLHTALTLTEWVTLGKAVITIGSAIISVLPILLPLL